MPRLIFVASALPRGGAERHALALMKRLTERGFECHAVSIKDLGWEPFDLGAGSGTQRCLNAARYLDPRAVAAFAAHVERIGPAAIVAANPYPLLYAWLARRLARSRARLIVTYHSTKPLHVKERLQMLAYRPLLWSADCAVFVAERQRRYCLRRGVLARRNEVIHNGIDTEHFRADPDPDARRRLRRALDFADADYVIGMAAWLRPEKNHVQLVDALAALRARGISARALLIGDGETRGAIEARARSLGVADSVRITGSRNDVRPYVDACDAMVLCSVAVETFSLGALEAMAMRKPVVHADLGGAAEMVFPGHNGFLFPVGDTPALVDRLAVLADPAVARRLGDNARAVVEARFSERLMVDRYANLLNELCAPRRAASARALFGAPRS